MPGARGIEVVTHPFPKVWVWVFTALGRKALTPLVQVSAQQLLLSLSAQAGMSEKAWGGRGKRSWGGGRVASD